MASRDGRMFTQVTYSTIKENIFLSTILPRCSSFTIRYTLGKVLNIKSINLYLSVLLLQAAILYAYTYQQV